MLLFSPVNWLLKSDVPVPSDVWESETVGLELVLQQTPFSVIGLPLSFMLAPPEVAVCCETEEATSVLSEGTPDVWALSKGFVRGKSHFKSSLLHEKETSSAVNKKNKKKLFETLLMAMVNVRI